MIAASDSISAAMSIYHYTFFIKLSYQEILSCSKNGLTFGCLGGFLEGTFSYIISEGVTSNFHYPYIGQEEDGRNADCKLDKKFHKKIVKIRNFTFISSKSCTDVKLALKRQPITVGITGFPLIYYGKGVFNNCKPTDVHDHAVLLVGFKEGKGWKIKNSWGKNWG